MQRDDSMPPADTTVRVGAMVPTYNRPDLLRACVLQMLNQSRVPDLICIHQNGHSDSYRWCIDDIVHPGLIWLHTPEVVRQHEWYARPLRSLLEAGCTHFLWIDHDDIYLREHVASVLGELRDVDFSVSNACGQLSVRASRYHYVPRMNFTSHAPGGMSSSMGFTAAFAAQLLQDIEAHPEETYTDNIVAKITMPRFSCMRSSRQQTIYVSHEGSVTSAGWLDSTLPNEAAHGSQGVATPQMPAKQADTSDSPARVCVFELPYETGHRDPVAPGLVKLPYARNERPDWYTTWSIRQFIAEQGMDEGTLYGFWSRRFEEKTGLSTSEAMQLLRASASTHDVVLFSPFPDLGAAYLNVFEQGEAYHPGCTEALQLLLDHMGITEPLSERPMDSRSTVFCDYFAARPAFWREWLRYAEALIDLAEGQDRSAARRLTAPTTYPKGAQVKAHLAERLASLVLVAQPGRWRVCAPAAFRMRSAAPALGRDTGLLLACDSLKRAYIESHDATWLAAYRAMSARLLASAAS